MRLATVFISLIRSFLSASFSLAAELIAFLDQGAPCQIDLQEGVERVLWVITIREHGADRFGILPDVVDVKHFLTCSAGTIYILIRTSVDLYELKQLLRSWSIGTQSQISPYFQ
jgi:hypothetical protein